MTWKYSPTYIYTSWTILKTIYLNRLFPSQVVFKSILHWKLSNKHKLRDVLHSPPNSSSSYNGQLLATLPLSPLHWIVLKPIPECFRFILKYFSIDLEKIRTSPIIMTEKKDIDFFLLSSNSRVQISPVSRLINQDLTKVPILHLAVRSLKSLIINL